MSSGPTRRRRTPATEETSDPSETPSSCSAPIGSVMGAVHPRLREQLSEELSRTKSRNSELFPAKGSKIVREERAVLLSLLARPLCFRGNGASVWLGHSRGRYGRDDGLFTL